METEASPTRQSRVKKKSSIDSVDSEAAAAVMGRTTPVTPEPMTAGDAAPAEDAPEESIYEVMKATMRRQKEEQDAKNAAMKQDRARGQSGRPGPIGGRPGPEQAAPPPVEKVSDLADLPAIWEATRRHLNQAARYLESVLGHCCKVESLARETAEVVLAVPASQKGFTNERARVKIEESMRAVTGLGIRLGLTFIESTEPAGGADFMDGARGAGPAAASQTAQRIPPELLEAVKAQPLIQELMKRLDASVVHVEMLNTED